MKTFTLLCLFVSALAAPAPQAAPANCAEIQTKLEKGIQANLDIQAQELKGYVHPPPSPLTTPQTNSH
jgi:hypothetical protein